MRRPATPILRRADVLDWLTSDEVGFTKFEVRQMIEMKIIKGSRPPGSQAAKRPKKIYNREQIERDVLNGNNATTNSVAGPAVSGKAEVGR